MNLFTVFGRVTYDDALVTEQTSKRTQLSRWAYALVNRKEFTTVNLSSCREGYRLFFNRDYLIAVFTFSGPAILGFVETISK